MEVTVKLFATPVSWNKDGYQLVSSTYNLPNDYPANEGVLVGEVTIDINPPTHRQLVAQEIKNLRRVKKDLLNKMNKELLPIDTRIQNLLALEA